MLLKVKSADIATLPSAALSLPPDSLNTEHPAPIAHFIRTETLHLVHPLLFFALCFGICCNHSFAVIDWLE